MSDIVVCNVGYLSSTDQWGAYGFCPECKQITMWFQNGAGGKATHIIQSSVCVQFLGQEFAFEFKLSGHMLTQRAHSVMTSRNASASIAPTWLWWFRFMFSYRSTIYAFTWFTIFLCMATRLGMLIGGTSPWIRYWRPVAGMYRNGHLKCRCCYAWEN